MMTKCEAHPGEDASVLDPVLDCLGFLARRLDRPSSPVQLRAGRALSDKGCLPFHQVEPALDQVGMRGQILVRRHLAGWPARQLPAILELGEGGAAVLLETRDGDALTYHSGLGEAMWVPLDRLEADYAGRAVVVDADPTAERTGERPWQVARRRHWFWSQWWAARRDFWPVLLAAGIANLLAIAVPLFTMNVYDRVIPNQAQATLWVLALGVVIALGFDFVLRLSRARLVDDIGRRLDARFAEGLFEKLLNLPLKDRAGSTGAMARRVGEYEGVRDFFASTTIVLAIDLAFLSLFLVLIALLGGWLVLVPLVGIGAMLGAGLGLNRAMAAAARDAQTDSSLQHSLLVEAIAGLETVKASRAEGMMLGRWSRVAAMAAGTQERLRRLNAIAVNLATVTQQLMSVGLVIGGFYAFHAGKMSMGAIIAIVMLAGRAMAPVGQLAFLITRGRQALTSMESLQALADSADERHTGPVHLLRGVAAGAVTLDGAGFTYPHADRPSLSGIDLAIAPGERIGIIGRIASGKSTLGRMLCGLYPPTEGAMRIDDLDSQQYHLHQLRDAFRYVGQDSELFSGTVRDNLRLAAPDADEDALMAAVRRSGADAFLAHDRAGLDRPVGERGQLLSGGQRALLVLARAMVTPAKLLFLDEPSGAMDGDSEARLIARLRDGLGDDQTLVLATHRMAMLALVDRLIVIDGGRIVADGPKAAVLAQLAGGGAREAAE